MEAFTDSIEASQNRLTVAMERWVLQLEANGAIKLFYDTLATAVENLDVLIATIGGLLILTNFNKVVNTLITAGGSLGSQFTKLGGAIETIIALSSGQGGYRKEVYNEAVSNFQSAYVRGQQKNYANTLAQFIPTMGAETVGKFTSLQNNLITSTQAQIDDFFEALENGFTFQDPKVIKDMIVATEDQTKVAKLNAQLTRQQNIASQLLNVAQEGQGKQTLQAIANGEALEGTTHNLSAAQQELTNTTKKANQQMLNQIKTNANNFQQKGGKSGAALQTGIGFLSLGAGIGGAQVGGKIGSFFGDTGSVIGTTIGTMAAPAMVQALGKKISEAAAGAALAKVGLAIANPVASIAASVLIALAPSIIDAFYTSAEERAEQLAEKFNQESDKYTTYLNVTTSVADYDELSKGVDALGRNVSLTDEEYQKWLDSSNAIAEVFPQLISYTDEQGNKIVGLDGKVANLTDTINEYTEAQQRNADQALLADGLFNVNYKNAKKEWDNAKKQIEDSTSLYKALDEARASSYDAETETALYNIDANNSEIKKIVSSLNSTGLVSASQTGKTNEFRVIGTIDEINKALEKAKQDFDINIDEYTQQMEDAANLMQSEIDAIFREMQYDSNYVALFENMSETTEAGLKTLIRKIGLDAEDEDAFREQIENTVLELGTYFNESGIDINLALNPDTNMDINEFQTARKSLLNGLINVFGGNVEDLSDDQIKIICAFGFKWDEDETEFTDAIDSLQQIIDAGLDKKVVNAKGDVLGSQAFTGASGRFTYNINEIARAYKILEK